MARGGLCQGAGRKKGSKNKTTKMKTEFAALAASSGVTPLEVMLKRMKTLLERGDDKSMKEAVQVAALAAPYVHAKLANVIQENKETVRHVSRLPEECKTIDEWQARYAPLLSEETKPVAAPTYLPKGETKQ